MADLDRLATTASTRLATTLARLHNLAKIVVAITAVIGIATFATGLWVFDRNRSTWIVLGGAMCLVPIVAALVGWFYVGITRKTAPRLLADVRVLLKDSRPAAGALIDHDSGQALIASSKSFRKLRTTLKSRRGELPGLFAVIRAITGVPGLAAIAVLGTLIVGAVGTILLIAGLVK